MSQSLFSQTKDPKKPMKEMLLGTWVSAESNGVLKYKFLDDKFYIIKGDSIQFTCNDYELKNKSLDTHCPGKEKLVFKIKTVTDSTLFMKSMNSDYYHKYTRVAAK
jgi:hypothetical protein